MGAIVTPNSATTNVNVTGNGTVTLRLTVTSNATPGCGTAFSDIILTVNPNPAAAAGVDQTLCQTVPGPTVFTVTGTATNGTPTWNVLSTTGTAVATIVSPNSATTAVNVTGAGSVTLRLTVTSANCGAVTDDVVLIVLPAPIANAGIDQAACQTIPGPTVFTVSGVAANGIPATPAWTLVGTTGTAVPTILTPNNTTTGVNITGIGTVTLRFTVNSSSVPSCGMAFDDVMLTVTTNAIALAGPDQALCQTVPGPTVFTVSGTGGSPSWSVLATTGTAAATIVSPNTAITPVNVTGLGTVTLRLTTTSLGCGTATSNVVLTVNANPAAAAGPDQMLCQVVPGPTVFTVTGIVSGGTPQWSVLSTTGTASAIIVSPNSATTNVNVVGIGTVTLRLTVSSNVTPNCGTAASDVVPMVNPAPATVITVPPVTCAASPGNTASVPDAGVGATYVWTITNGTITSGQGTRTITWTAGVVVPTTLSITVTNGPGCSSNASVSINSVLCDLMLIKSVDKDFAKVTEIVTFTLTVRNNGQLPASNVVVTDLLPSGFVFVSATPSQGAYNSTTGVWTVGTLNAGASATLLIRAAVNASGSYLNIASVVSGLFDSVAGNNQATASVTRIITYGPGLPYPPSSEVSDQKSGSVLIFPCYSSSASAPNTQNTRICLTNIEQMDIIVHLFFVEGASCSVADAFVRLTGNQTTCFQISDLDPGTTGYTVAVAVGPDGCPINFNCLIGGAFVKLSSGHQANLGAEAFAAQVGADFGCDGNSTTATLRFNGLMYNRARA